MQRKATKSPGVPLSRRAFAGLPATVDVASRSFEIVIATDTPVRTWIPNPTITNPEPEDISWLEVDEVLIPSGMDFSRVRGMPLMDNHDTFSGLRSQIGRVDNVRIEGNSVLGTAILSNKDSHLITDIAEGFFCQVSAGYCHLEAELIERAEEVPLLMVTRWTLHEASLVPVSADPNAFVRGQRTYPRPDVKVRALETEPEEKKIMELEELVTAAEDAIMAADAAVQAVVDAKDEGATEEVVERAKAIRAKRAEGDEPEKKDDAQAASADDEAKGTDEEKKEIEEVRALARSLGLSKIVDDGVKLRSSANAIRAGLRTAYFARSTAPAQTQDVAAITKGQRDADTKINVRSVYDNINGRSNAGGARSN